MSANSCTQIIQITIYPLVDELQTESLFAKSRQGQQYNLFVEELPQIQERFFINFRNKLSYTFFCFIFINPD